MISTLALQAARWVSTDRRRTILAEPAPRCLGTTGQHNGRNESQYVVGVGVRSRLATICDGCAAVYAGMGAAILPDRRA